MLYLSSDSIFEQSDVCMFGISRGLQPADAPHTIHITLLDGGATHHKLPAGRFLPHDTPLKAKQLMSEQTETKKTSRAHTQQNGSRQQAANRAPGVYGLVEIAENRLEPWPNPKSERDYIIHFEIPEFTCLCPRSGFPDFATIVIDYAPGPSVVELKSLKLYINGYRNRALSHEAATNTILDDLIATLAPRWMRVVAEFNVRGNIKTVVTAEHATSGYSGPRPEYRSPTFTGI